MKVGILETGHAPSQIQKTIGDYSEMFQALFSSQDFNLCLMMSKTWFSLNRLLKQMGG
jgi:hypothetical protein